MDVTASDRRLVENQVVFRTYNERVQKGLAKLNKMAAEDGHHQLQFDGSELLHFYCECSDEDCRQRIKIAPDTYSRIHESRNAFTIKRGHEVPQVENVTAVEKEYCVVTKFKPVPETANILHKTDVNNA